jgi:hypothetical protein
MNSTIYLFGQYFCWTQMLRQEMSFELFRSQEEMKKFFAAIDKVSNKLGDYPPIINDGIGKEYEGMGRDAQVFRLQQRAIGEVLAVRRGARRACCKYSHFLSKINDAAFDTSFHSVRQLVDQLQPTDRRWKRLEQTREALSELREECDRLLKLPNSGGIADEVGPS